MTVLQVLARVEVTDLETSIPRYRQLAGVVEVRRFSLGQVEFAWVGPFLLLAGTPIALVGAQRTATLLVNDLDDAERVVLEFGGIVWDGIAAGPNGRQFVAQHPDGALFEYLEPWDAES